MRNSRKTRVGLALATALILAAHGGNVSGAAWPDVRVPGTPPSGEPLKLAQVAYLPEVLPVTLGIELAIETINAAGGVHGRPLELVACSDNRDQNTAAECVRKAIADPDVIGFVGNNSTLSASMLPQIEQAEMASFGHSLITEPDFVSPSVFPVDGGRLTAIPGLGSTCIDVVGAETIGLPYPDASGGGLIELLANNVTRPRGLPDPVGVGLPDAATDFSAQAAAVRDTDCVVVALAGDMPARFVRAAHQQGVEAPMVLPGRYYNVIRVVEDFGEDAQNVYMVTSNDITSEGFEEIEEAANRYRPDELRLLSDASVQGWLGVMVFVDIASGLDEAELTRAAVLSGAHAVAGFDTKGLTVLPLDYTAEATAMGGAVPNLYPSVLGQFVFQYSDGELVPMNDGESLHVLD